MTMEPMSGRFISDATTRYCLPVCGITTVFIGCGSMGSWVISHFSHALS
jgi:hypothetical protein